MNPQSLTIALKEKARRLGFDLVGATPAVTPPGIEHLERWLADGLAGEMRYFSRRISAYRDPGLILAGVKSVLMLGVNYRTAEPVAAGPGQGKVSRYAWGSDYHDVIRRKLRELAQFHRQLVPHCGLRGVVDTAPLLERGFAQRAGLGWIGKNTLLINEQFGSWIFLAALLTTEELQFDEPTLFKSLRRLPLLSRCLSNRRFGSPLSSRCAKVHQLLDYRSARPHSPKTAKGLRRSIVWLRCMPGGLSLESAHRSGEKNFQPRPGMNPVDLAELFSLSEEGFRQRFRDTPLWRVKLAGLLRNAAGILGNQQH